MPRNPLQPHRSDPKSWANQIIREVMLAYENGTLRVAFTDGADVGRLVIEHAEQKTIRRLRKIVVRAAKEFAGYVIANQSFDLAQKSGQILDLKNFIQRTHILACGSVKWVDPAAQTVETNQAVCNLKGRVGTLEASLEAARANESVQRRRAEEAEAELEKLRSLVSKRESYE